MGSTTNISTWDVNASLPVIMQDGTCTYVYGHGLVSQTENDGTLTSFLTNGLGSTDDSVLSSPPLHAMS